MHILTQLLPALLAKARTIDAPANTALTTEDGQPLVTEDGVQLTPEPTD